jgi:hypothetical protein
MRRSRYGVLALLLSLLPAALTAQVIRGRVLDQSRRPLVGALVELRTATGKSIQIVITSPSGAFQLTAPAPGHYLYRVAGIGFQPRPLTPLDVPADGVTLPDIVLSTMTTRLPDLIALGRGRYCGKSGLSDDMFAQVLESAHSALQIMETMIRTHQIAFQTATITTSTFYGAFSNFEAADTAVQTLTQWPITSIDPDTLRVVGFGRTVDAGNEYYGPDERVLFSEWFLDSHCFTVDKPKKKGPNDSLYLRFTPAKKTKLIDVGGELVLDAHNLALLQFSFRLTNLPSWMPEEAAGGYMEFSRLVTGIWVAKTWSIWGPRPGISPGGAGRGVAGVLEKYGWVLRVYSGADTIVVAPRDTLR